MFEHGLDGPGPQSLQVQARLLGLVTGGPKRCGGEEGMLFMCGNKPGAFRLCTIDAGVEGGAFLSEMWVCVSRLSTHTLMQCQAPPPDLR